MYQYAWLEFDEGKWHFHTNLYDFSTESTKCWPNRHLALTELRDEGWRIVRAYPGGQRIEDEDGESVDGYGLTRCLLCN